jgi:hypothetical protein
VKIWHGVYILRSGPTSADDACWQHVGRFDQTRTRTCQSQLLPAAVDQGSIHPTQESLTQKFV